MWDVLKAQQVRLATMEAADVLNGAHLTTQGSLLPSALNVARDLVVNVVEVVAIEEAADGLLQTLAELTSTLSMEL
jgi:hypothetical protein